MISRTGLLEHNSKTIFLELAFQNKFLKIYEIFFITNFSKHIKCFLKWDFKIKFPKYMILS